MAEGWRVEHRRGGAQELHDLAVLEPIAARAVVVQEVTSPALVLGSTQPVGDVDVARLEAEGIELARRRSGGGAVLLRPGDHVWVDLTITADDPLQDPDVGRAPWWVGETFLDALGGSSTVGSTRGRGEVHHGGLTDRGAGSLACFAAVGPGEVVVDGCKVLGISQRRSRSGTRFQCIAYRLWEPELLVSLLSVPSSRSDAVASALLERAGAALEAGWGVVEDLVPALP